MVWSPLAGGLLTGRYRKGQENDTHRATYGFKYMRDERRLNAVEQLISLAEDADMKLTHMAMAFTLAHPGVTSAILGPRTMAHLNDLLAGAETVLSDEILDRIDEIVPPGTNVSPLDHNYQPPAIQEATLRRRPVTERSAV